MRGRWCAWLWLAGSGLLAQPRGYDQNVNAWLMYFGGHKFNDRWGLHLEGQWRRSHWGAAPQQVLLRPGLHFHVNENVLLTGGYAYVRSSRYGDLPSSTGSFPEHRLFQQVIVNHGPPRLRLQHRWRLEQRWIGGLAPSGAEPQRVDGRYQQRYRQWLRVTTPLRGKSYLAFYDEVFLNLAPNTGPNVFEQNRAYGAVGWPVAKETRVEVGYLHQLVAQRNGRVRESNHTLQIGIYCNLRFGR